jgi:hypothetical protein
VQTIFYLIVAHYWQTFFGNSNVRLTNTLIREILNTTFSHSIDEFYDVRYYKIPGFRNRLDLIFNNDEELHVSKAFTVTLDWKSANVIDVIRGTTTLPRQPGIYIIYHGAKAHYVGISERNLHSRFRNRLRVFREFDVNINSLEFTKLLNNRTVVWATIKNIVGPIKGGVKQGEKNFKVYGKSLKRTGGVSGQSGLN